MLMSLAMLPLGPTEILVIAGVVVLLFGSTKIPSLMRGLGQGISEFKTGLKEPAKAADEEQKKPDDQKKEEGKKEEGKKEPEKADSP